MFAKFAVLSNILTGSESPTSYIDHEAYTSQQFAETTSSLYINKLENIAQCTTQMHWFNQIIGLPSIDQWYTEVCVTRPNILGLIHFQKTTYTRLTIYVKILDLLHICIHIIIVTCSGIWYDFIFAFSSILNICRWSWVVPCSCASREWSNL